MEPRAFYQEQIQILKAKIKDKKQQLFVLSMLRLAVFLAAALTAYFFFNIPLVLGGSIALGLIAFLVLVSYYVTQKQTLQFLQELLKQNELELAVMQGDLSSLDPGTNFIYEQHHFNQDIDLFGEGSLFQIINRTVTANGKKQLAQWLNANSIDNIHARQEAIKEIGKNVEWRQQYTATGALIDSEIPSESIVNWVKNYTPYVANIYAWLPIAFSIISVGIITTFFLNIVPGLYLGIWFFLGLGLTGRYLKKTTALFNITSKIDSTLAHYSKLLKYIEDATFDSELLNAYKEQIKTQGVKPSQRLKELNTEINHLANRNNFIFAPLGNGFLLWDLRYAYRIEQWIKNFDGAMGNWFDVIESFDAMNSYGNYVFNHPNYTYPTINAENSKEQLNAVNLGHPLLNEASMVRNSIRMQKDDFFIITGANMAGKSTFLRTVAVNLVMANCGLPVCAESYIYTPIKLISSMRTSDSLMNDESYFFSELKRLKFIVEAIKHDNYFIILDEILKGTNSKDKAEGSKKFVERLVASNSTGLIATHDLSLCTLEGTLDEISNYYFDAEIINDELHFDYTFKTGVCQNMNASFLLKKMEIV